MLRRSEKLSERSEGEIGLRLPARRMEHCQASLSVLRSVVKEHRLAHPGLTCDEQRGPLASHGSVDERLERRALPPAADQHTLILIDRGSET